MATAESTLIGPLQMLLERLLAFLPQLLAAFFIAVCGLLAGWLLTIGLRRVLLLLKFDTHCARLGLKGLLGSTDVSDIPSTMLARFSGGLVVLIFLFLALNSLDVVILQKLTERTLVYIPNLMVAGLILLSALFVGNFVAGAVLIASVNAGNHLARLCARLAYVLVLGLGVAMALEQLDIGKDAVLLAFAIAFGGLVLALALAFGLGGRELARDFLEKKLRPVAEEDELEHL